MQALVVEDEFVARRVLQRFLSQYGVCDVAVDGEEALAAVRRAHEESTPYELICLDIRLPHLGGQDVLAQVRAIEEDHGLLLGQGAKVIMTTGVTSKDDVLGAFRGGADAYLLKPITLSTLTIKLLELRLID